MELDMLMALQF